MVGRCSKVGQIKVPKWAKSEYRNQKVARVADRRQAEYRCSMASDGFCTVLDVAVETKSYWPPRNQQRGQGVDPEDHGSESFMGEPTGTWGTSETRNSHLGTDCCPAHAEEEETTITDLANLPGQSSLGPRLNRLSRCAYSDVQSSICVDCPSSSTPARRALQRD